MVRPVMQYKYLVSYKVSEYSHEDYTHVTSNKVKVDFFTDKELEDFCNNKHAVSATYLGQCREKPIEVNPEGKFKLNK